MVRAVVVAASVMVVAVGCSPGPPAASGDGIQAREVENLFDPGGEFHCVGLLGMSGPDAQVWLENRGYDVVWQAWTPQRGGFEVEAPPVGTLVGDALFEEDGRLRVFVEPPERYQAIPEDCG